MYMVTRLSPMSNIMTVPIILLQNTNPVSASATIISIWSLYRNKWVPFKFRMVAYRAPSEHVYVTYCLIGDCTCNLEWQPHEWTAVLLRHTMGSIVSGLHACTSYTFLIMYLTSRQIYCIFPIIVCSMQYDNVADLSALYLVSENPPHWSTSECTVDHMVGYRLDPITPPG